MKTFLEDLVYGRRKSVPIGLFLSMLSVIYRIAITLRRFVYGSLCQKKLTCRVISVGNITLGGTGKTPAVIEIAGLLRDRGKHPVVVSRGYGRVNESQISVVSDGEQADCDTAVNGDEPVLIASRLPGVPVVVGSDRYRASLLALERFRVDVIILDDGFQHLRLRRDMDIVLIDAADPFGTGKLFPAGILREPLTALKRAHAVVITRVEAVRDISGLMNQLSKITRAKIYSSSHVPKELVNVMTGETRPLSSLKGLHVVAFSGIARPASFRFLLEQMGAQIRNFAGYPDHYVYQKTDLADIYQRAADAKADMILTTDKDGVRLRRLRPEGIWGLRIALEVAEKEAWEQMLSEAV
jgi:tetraacyldisaccharide 4'-kinase